MQNAESVYEIKKELKREIMAQWDEMERKIVEIRNENSESR